VDGGLRKRRRNPFEVADDVNPLDGVANIADAMLAFSCGLLLALAIYWNIDLGPTGERIDVTRGREVTEVPEIREDLIETRDRGKLYERVGTVYRDPETGQLFMLTDDN